MHLSVVELVRTAVVCKEWKQSISMYTAAKRAAMIAAAEAPDSLPEESLTNLQLVFRWLKRTLLLQYAKTGKPFGQNLVKSWGFNPKYEAGYDEKFRWFDFNEIDAEDVRRWEGMFCRYADEEEGVMVFCQSLGHHDYLGEGPAYGIFIDVAGIDLTVEVVRSSPATVSVLLEYSGDQCPWIGVHWIDSIVLAFAQGMSVRLPQASPNCWLSWLPRLPWQAAPPAPPADWVGPLASRIKLQVNMLPAPLLEKPWMLTLPGWTRVIIDGTIHHDRYLHRSCEAYSILLDGPTNAQPQASCKNTS